MPEPFISREDLGNKLNLDLDANEDALMCVDAACDMCRDISEQAFNRGTTEFVLNGSGTEVQLLPQYPVNNVGTVTENGTVIDDAEWVVDVQTGSLIRVPSTGYVTSNTSLAPTVVWDRGLQNIAVEYDHGWDLDDIPRSVRMVALNIAARLFKQKVATFESLGDYSVRYDGGPGDLTENELRILHKYKRQK